MKREEYLKQQEIAALEWRPGDPTEAEIRERCLAIQSRWSAQERRRRAAWAHEREEVRFDCVALGELSAPLTACEAG